ncbi:AAA family ATPase [Exiguobacterium antarcticum]|uniref:AAA family ATPase n=1 Tax=Exiguobacterium antarcticum TaxID=132920 RepID=A0ABT6R634_9BACL|nr:AAA family ATPase [Exiguobacterium antarcticum]MDI3236422.1 AAA family ATPase [Exiguobacterium antarcticum]
MKTKEKKLISFYSSEKNQGLKTLSLSFASRLAADNYRVLYVELDTRSKGFAQTIQIDTEKQNINEYFLEALKGNFSIEKFVITKDMLLEESSKITKDIFNELENNLDYLVLPMEIEADSEPSLVGENASEFDSNVIEYVDNIIETLQNTEYDHIVLKLPNDLDHVFTVQTLNSSNLVVSVYLPTVSQAIEQKKIKKYLFEHNKNLSDKWKDVANMVSAELPQKTIEETLKDSFIVEYDPHRLPDEWAFRTDSTYIRERMEELIDSFGINIIRQKHVEKKRFGRFTR